MCTAARGTPPRTARDLPRFDFAPEGRTQSSWSPAQPAGNRPDRVVADVTRTDHTGIHSHSRSCAEGPKIRSPSDPWSPVRETASGPSIHTPPRTGPTDPRFEVHRFLTRPESTPLTTGGRCVGDPCQRPEPTGTADPPGGKTEAPGSMRSRGSSAETEGFSEHRRSKGVPECSRPQCG